MKNLLTINDLYGEKIILEHTDNKLDLSINIDNEVIGTVTLDKESIKKLHEYLGNLI